MKRRPDDLFPRVTWPIRNPKARGAAVEFCCGMGGIGIGLAAAGYEVVAAYDAWPEAVAVYNHNAPKPVAKACDVLSEEGKRTIRKYRRELGEIHLLAAGPPCKGFSQIRNGTITGRTRTTRFSLRCPSTSRRSGRDSCSSRTFRIWRGIATVTRCGS